METIEVNTNPNGDAQWNLVHRIPAPIDKECLTSPDQIEPGDHVMVHAMGTWYPATAIAIKTRGVGRVEVEYTSGTRTVRRKAVRRTELVPSMCGYPKRTHSMEALAWAAAVWGKLAAYREWKDAQDKRAKIAALPEAPPEVYAEMDKLIGGR